VCHFIISAVRFDLFHEAWPCGPHRAPRTAPRRPAGVEVEHQGCNRLSRTGHAGQNYPSCGHIQCWLTHGLTVPTSPQVHVRLLRTRRGLSAGGRGWEGTGSHGQRVVVLATRERWPHGATCSAPKHSWALSAGPQLRTTPGCGRGYGLVCRWGSLCVGFGIQKALEALRSPVTQREADRRPPPRASKLHFAASRCEDVCASPLPDWPRRLGALTPGPACDSAMARRPTAAAGCASARTGGATTVKARSSARRRCGPRCRAQCSAKGRPRFADRAGGGEV
jgi:hypothetical protein